MKKADLLLIGQTPPPYHGQAVVTGMLFEHDWPGLDVHRLRMFYSNDIQDVGKASVGKLIILFVLIIKTWWIILRYRPKILYYPPASPNAVPVLRDIVYLGLVRWFFPKLVLHFHAGGLDQFCAQRGIFGFFAKIMYARADSAIDVNVTEPPSGKYFQAKCNLVVMNGVSVGDDNAVKVCDVQNKKFQILYVGLLCKEKGVFDLLETAKLLKELKIECEFVMVGAWKSDEVKENFESQASVNKVDKMFRFRGSLQGVDKWNAYAEADMFIFPTLHPTETFGMVVIEAMAYSLPIVASRWRGIPHVVGKDGCAILCDPGNATEYAMAISRIAGDQSLREVMEQRAAIRYRKYFTQKRFLARMEEVFKPMLIDSKKEFIN